MNNNIRYLIGFVVGLGVGAGVTYKLLKDKLEERAQADIQAVRDYYNEKNPEEKIEENVQQIEAADKAKNKPDISEYVRKIKEGGYTNYSNSKEPATDTKAITYIAPEEFGNEPEYDEIFLDYWQDGVLTDERGEVIEDFMSIVGNFTTHFNEFEDGVVCVQNDIRKAYYQISIDYRNYKDTEDGE